LFAGIAISSTTDGRWTITDPSRALSLSSLSSSIKLLPFATVVDADQLFLQASLPAPDPSIVSLSAETVLVDSLIISGLSSRPPLESAVLLFVANCLAGTARIQRADDGEKGGGRGEGAAVDPLRNRRNPRRVGEERGRIWR
jgi:hypothetical protein